MGSEKVRYKVNLNQFQNQELKAEFLVPTKHSYLVLLPYTLIKFQTLFETLGGQLTCTSLSGKMNCGSLRETGKPGLRMLIRLRKSVSSVPASQAGDSKSWVKSKIGR